MKAKCELPELKLSIVLKRSLMFLLKPVYGLVSAIVYGALSCSYRFMG